MRIKSQRFGDTLSRFSEIFRAPAGLAGSGSQSGHKGSYDASRRIPFAQLQAFIDKLKADPGARVPPHGPKSKPAWQISCQLAGVNATWPTILEPISATQRNRKRAPASRTASINRVATGKSHGLASGEVRSIERFPPEFTSDLLATWFLSSQPRPGLPAITQAPAFHAPRWRGRLTLSGLAVKPRHLWLQAGLHQR